MAFQSQKELIFWLPNFVFFFTFQPLELEISCQVIPGVPKNVPNFEA